MADAGIVHTGSIAALMQPGATDVVRILELLHPTALVTYDPNVRPALLGDAAASRDQVEALVATADLVKASDEDLLWLYPDRSPVDVARSWLETGPAIVVVTSGEGGAIALARSGLVVVEAQRVDVIDTVGAGDTFMGAMIDGLVRYGYHDAGARQQLRHIASGELAAMLRFSTLAAAITVTRPGADPPRRDELDAALTLPAPPASSPELDGADR